MFDNYIDKITKEYETNRSVDNQEVGISAGQVMSKLGESTSRFKQVAVGYTG